MNRSQGFSLVELLVVLAVVAFLAFITAPLATSWIRNAQLERDFAGVQRALGTAKALAMRNSNGVAASDNVAANAAFPAEVVTVALCRSGDDLFVAASPPAPAAPVNCAEAAWNRLPTGRPIYHMGQDVAITFSNQKNFCGALFDARGRVRLCEGNPCTTCTTAFDSATGLSVLIAGADSFKDAADSNKSDPKDQSNIIRAF